MSKPTRPWTEKDELNRASIVVEAATKGISHIRLAKAIKVNQTKFHRWSKGQAHLTDDQVTQLREYIANGYNSVSPGVLFSNSGKSLDDILKELNHLDTNNVPEDENDVMRYLARKYSTVVVNQAFFLMATAKSESVRARMVEFLREIGFGKAIQTQDREIPKPPMEDEELLDTLNRLLANQFAPNSNSSGTANNAPNTK